MNNNFITLIPIFLPIICGLLIPLFNFEKKIRERYILTVVIINTLLVFYMILSGETYYFSILNMSELFDITFKLDGAGKVFSFLVSMLWPLATMYAFEYMEHEENVVSFFRYYTITYGIALGVAFSENLITMYLFYEILTFITLPIIMHEGDKKSLAAGRFYLLVSILGAAMGLMGIFILSIYSKELSFSLGGVLTNVNAHGNEQILLGYLLCFFGFGVKAAIIPFIEWLPKCGVAPTPVTALLHAVAVVKAGVFAIIRVTYYAYGTSVIFGTYAQNIALIIAMCTILYGSSMAIYEQNIKRRLAYSTASNLSYILLVVCLMTEQGLVAGFTHMIFHGIIKITLFFVAGSLIVNAGVKEVKEVRGLAKYMPKTFIVWTIASLALIGVPLTCGFISKYQICSALVNSNLQLGTIGIIVIIISAIFTCIYLLTIMIPAYLPGENFDDSKIKDKKDPGFYMLIPYLILVILIIYFGINSTPLIEFFEKIAQGLI